MIHLSPAQKRLIAVVVVIAVGVALRLYGASLGAPAFVVKYGGSALWAAMFYLLTALLLRDRTRTTILIVAGGLCATIEVGKLIHTPALDIFRLTPAGAWLLGRIFAWANFLAYAAGLAAIWALDGVFTKFSAQPGGKSSAQPSDKSPAQRGAKSPAQRGVKSSARRSGKSAARR